MENMFSLQGKIALITGASYGIGFEIAKAYAQAGATIVFNDIKQELVDKGLAAYRELGIEAHGYVCDVTDEAGIQQMVSQIEDEVGVIDILVNNAGIIRRTPMLEMAAEDFRQVIDIDLNAPFIVSKVVLPSMIAKGHGKIINICSMMSELGRETVSAYAAAKGGLKMLTKNIASEFGEANIQCNGIGPGYIATPQTAPLRERQADGSRHPFDQFIIAKTPAARCGTGVGAMLALNSFPGVTCGFASEPTEAYLFSQINGGNALSIPFAKGFGWGAELNLTLIFERLFAEPMGGGYPKERAIPEQRNARILSDLKKITYRDLLAIVKDIDQDFLKETISGAHFKEYFFANAEPSELVAYLKSVLEQ